MTTIQCAMCERGVTEDEARAGKEFLKVVIGLDDEEYLDWSGVEEGQGQGMCPLCVAIEIFEALSEEQEGQNNDQASLEGGTTDR